MNLVPDHSVSSLKAGITARPEPGQLTRVEHYSDLEFMEKVGGGGYGTVSKGRWISRDKIVAIKTLIVFDEREVNHRVVYCKNYNNFVSPVLNILLGCSWLQVLFDYSGSN